MLLFTTAQDSQCHFVANGFFAKVSLKAVNTIHRGSVIFHDNVSFAKGMVVQAPLFLERFHPDP